MWHLNLYCFLFMQQSIRFPSHELAFSTFHALYYYDLKVCLVFQSSILSYSLLLVYFWPFVLDQLPGAGRL